MKAFSAKNKRAPFLLVLLAILCAPVFIPGIDAAGLWNRGDHTIDANWDMYKAIVYKSGSTLQLDSGMTFTGNNLIDASDIADVERTFNLQIVAAFIDGTGVIGDDATTAPGVAETDDIPAIVWASNENTPVQWTFELSPFYSTGLGFRILCSESSDTTPSEIDWQIWVNEDGVTFDAGAITQAAVALAGDSSGTNEVVTLIVDSTGLTAISAGTWVTLDIWNTNTGSGDLEVKGVQGYYTATM